MKGITFGLFIALLALTVLIAGCTSVGKPMRHDPESGVPLSKSWYLESKPVGDALPVSCSFIEFDGRGDYIDIRQHAAAWTKVKQLAETQPLLLVFYCHGWKNNSQSGDVLEFSEFLSRLSRADALGNLKYRVHGIYLGWRGNVFQPFVSKGQPGDRNAYRISEELFGEPIIDDDHHRSSRLLTLLPEQLSYWGRRNAAENKVSSVPIARTIFTCASLAKAMDHHQSRTNFLQSSRVMVMGHSFGALLLERALNATCIDPLTDQWTWFEKHTESGKTKLRQRTDPALTKVDTNPLPLDFVLFVNSAAPSIYAKTMRDFLTAHRSALEDSGSTAANTPVFISITSAADGATRKLHPLANTFSFFYPSLQHSYTNLLKIPANSPRRVHQSAFFKRTPGHNPLLVDHWLERRDPLPTDPIDHDNILNYNLDYFTDDPLSFLAVSPKDKSIRRWAFSLTPPDKSEHSHKSELRWSRQFGSVESNRSSYWIIRCNSGLIREHNDVWSDTAMQMYAGLYRLVEWTRQPANQHRVNEVFENYWSSGHPVRQTK